MKGNLKARTAEAVIRMTYAFAAVGKIIGGDEEKYAVWYVSYLWSLPIPNSYMVDGFSNDLYSSEHATSECTSLIMNELLNLDFVFGLSDPSELIVCILRYDSPWSLQIIKMECIINVQGQHLRFFRSREGVILAEGMPIEAIRISNGGENIYKVLEYRTAKNPEVISSPMKPSGEREHIHSSSIRPSQILDSVRFVLPSVPSVDNVKPSFQSIQPWVPSPFLFHSHHLSILASFPLRSSTLSSLSRCSLRYAWGSIL